MDKAWVDRYYFDGYAQVDIHKEMIKDNVRTNAYKKAIYHYRQFIEGKVVLDVGCGTGILSIFCARAGATRVYAVDASEIALQAKLVVKANNLSDIITVLHQQVEDVQINEKVDVIISEWMGYMLLQENMLRSVITARDRWLKPGGLILPSNGKLHMAPFTNSERYIDAIRFWHNVHGIDMSALIPLDILQSFEEPSLETIKNENVLACPHMVKSIDLYVVTMLELESITTSFTFYTNKRAPLLGFAFWFEVEFAGTPVVERLVERISDLNEALLLSTAPQDCPTHWKQTLVYCCQELALELKECQTIKGSLTLSPHDRALKICLKYVAGDRSFKREAVF